MTEHAERGHGADRDAAVDHSEATYEAAAQSAEVAHELLGAAEDRLAELRAGSDQTAERVAENDWAQRVEDADAASLHRQRASNAMRDARDARDLHDRGRDPAERPPGPPGNGTS